MTVPRQPILSGTLRGGPGGLPRSRVFEIQRSRMLAALVQCCEDDDIQAITVAKIIGRARVSRKTFYEQFCDREDCLLAAFEQAVDDARLLAVAAYEREPGWRQGMRSALSRLLAFFDEEPVLARLLLLYPPTARGNVQAASAQVLAELARAVDRGRDAEGASRHAPAFTGEAVVGGILTVVSARLPRSEAGPLTALLGPLMSMIVLPYLGADAARRELRLRGTPAKAPARPQASETDPLAKLDMRLTYRTLHVLMVIAAHPGASNREIAEGAEVIDQGQISKLLSRLERLELVENEGLGQARGARNAWHLTPLGARLERATRRH